MQKFSTEFPLVHFQVREHCGQPKLLSEIIDVDSAEHRGLERRPQLPLPPQPSPRTKLHTRMQMFMRNLVAAKGFFRSLQDAVCSAEAFSAGLEEECWNGDDRAP